MTNCSAATNEFMSEETKLHVLGQQIRHHGGGMESFLSSQGLASKKTHHAKVDHENFNRYPDSSFRIIDLR